MQNIVCKYIVVSLLAFLLPLELHAQNASAGRKGQMSVAETEYSRIRQSQSLLSEGKGDLAKELLRRPYNVLSQDTLYYLMAETCYALEEWDSVHFYLQFSLKKNPVHAESYYLLGLACFEQHRFSEAVESFSKAIFLKDNMAKAYNDRGSAYRMMKLYEKALADYTEAIRYQSNPYYYNNRGSVKAKLSDWEGAVADYTQAFALDTSYYRTLNNRGVAYLNLAEFDSAAADFSQCIRMCPDYTSAYSNLGITHYRQRRYAEAVADFDKVISLSPDNGNAYLHRGNVKEMMDDEEGARTDWQKAVELGVEQASINLQQTMKR